MKHPTIEVTTRGSLLLERQPGFHYGTSEEGKLALVFSGVQGKHLINSVIERLEELRDEAL